MDPQALLAWIRSVPVVIRRMVGSLPLRPPWLPAVRAGRTDDAPPLHPALGGDLAAAVQAMAHVLVVVAWVLGHQLQAFAAAGHQGSVVGVDRGHGVVAAEGAFAGAVVDHSAVFIRRVVPLRSLVHQGRRLKAFRGVVEPAPWVAEGELPVRQEGVQVISVSHRLIPWHNGPAREREPDRRRKRR